jgi:formylglycine-generating enzyme required for sulfatase activity
MRRKPICILAALLILGLFALHAEPRVALVIGNGAYQYNNKLANPVNDASDLSRTLRELGFTVTTLTDAGLSRMSDAIYDFRNSLMKDTATVGVFIFAGHGVQSGGVNYLLPVDQDIRTETELIRKAIPAQEVLSYMNEARNAFNMVVLDACRNNPLAGSFRSGSRGLAAVASAPPQTLIVYSTDAGNVAEDGSGRNSPFASALMKYMKQPGLEAEAMLRRVTNEVSEATNNRQTPYKYSSMKRDFYFAGLGPAPVQQGSGTGTMTVEKSFGTIRVEVRETAKVYVDGVYKGEVPSGNAASITGVESGNRTVRLSYADGKTEDRTVSVTGNGTAYVSFNYQKPVPKEENMVYVAGGTFSMGSNSGYDWEKPVHSVTVSGFSMAKTEVTQKEFKDLMGFNPSNFKGDNLPVEQVTWYDAVAFCNAKSRKEGLKEVYTVTGITKDSDGNITSADVSADWSAKGYRLPTEAEWEWAARGGKSSRDYIFAGGNEDSEESIAWFDSNSDKTTHLVGTKIQNELEIFDLSGNVCEWCWDWYGSYSAGSQTDPKGRQQG